MLKVIQVLSDSNIGGAGKVVLNMIKYFDTQKINSKVIMPVNNKLKKLLANHCEILELKNLNEVSFDFSLIKIFLDIFRKEKPDIIHTHASFSARVAAKKLKIKTVYTRHWLGGERTNFFIKLLNNYYCDAAIAVSQAASNSLLLTGISDKKINIIHNGVDYLKKFLPIEKKILRAKYNLDQEFVFGTIARLEHVKGLKYFIDAANIFLKNYSNAKFFIFGDGSLKNQLENYVHEINRADKIIFKNNFHNLEEIINLFDIFILSSLQEALSLALLEAMSVGCACIATRCGGPEEIIINNHNGLLVKTQSAHELYNAMKILYLDQERREIISQNAYNMIQEKFSAKIMSDNITRLYLNLVNQT